MVNKVQMHSCGVKRNLKRISQEDLSERLVRAFMRVMLESNVSTVR